MLADNDFKEALQHQRLLLAVASISAAASYSKPVHGSHASWKRSADETWSVASNGSWSWPSATPWR